MAYIIIRPGDLVAAIDLDDFNPNCLTDGARLYFDKYQEAYYSEDPSEVDRNKMEKIK